MSGMTTASDTLAAFVAVLADSNVAVQARRYVDAVLTDAATDGHLREAGFGAP